MKTIKSIVEFDKSMGFDELLMTISRCDDPEIDNDFRKIYAVNFAETKIYNIDSWTIGTLKIFFNDDFVRFFVVKC